MSELHQRVARPSSEAESPGVSTPRGVNRNHLTLYLSIAAILLSVASAGVNLFVFLSAGQRKTVNEADELQLKASANRVLEELTVDPKSHTQLNAELSRLYNSLLYRPLSDARLTVYERAAFGLVVQAYAAPIAETQLRSAEAMGAVKGNTGYTMPLPTYRCIVDPFSSGCPAIAKGNDTNGSQDSKK